MEQLQEFVSLALAAIISFAIPVLVRLLNEWLKTRKAEVLSTLTMDQEAFLKFAVDIVVKAAEQSGLSGLISDIGSAKKVWALQQLQIILNSRGLMHISVEELATRIEAAIREGLQDPPPTISLISEVTSDTINEPATLKTSATLVQ